MSKKERRAVAAIVAGLVEDLDGLVPHLNYLEHLIRRTPSSSDQREALATLEIIHQAVYGLVLRVSSHDRQVVREANELLFPDPEQVDPLNLLSTPPLNDGHHHDDAGSKCCCGENKGG